MAHIPLPICATPENPHFKPILTLLFSYAVIHLDFFISPFFIIGPASIDVCISSPVLSRKPVFIKKTLLLSVLIHSFKLTEVLLSSSIIPHLIVFFLSFNTSSTFEKILSVNAVSSGPCILGLTIYIEPVLELPLFFISCIAAAEVINASIIPSGTSEPSFNIIAEFVIRCPTFLINNKLLPCNFSFLLFLEI